MRGIRSRREGSEGKGKKKTKKGAVIIHREKGTLY